MFHKTQLLKRRHTNSATGLEWETEVLFGIDEALADKAFSKLHPKELELLFDLITQGVVIELFRIGSVPQVGYYQPDTGTLALGVYPSGRFPKGMITHEGTHVQQYKEGRLKILDENRVLWEGKEWPLYQKGVRYLDSPWEQEAHRAQYAFMATLGLRIPVWLRMTVHRWCHRLLDC